MNFIGNDIVDLKTPEAMGKSADIRFVRRVLNASEQRLVFASDHPDLFLWALWAAKEAAFKAVSKAYPDVSSAPRRYLVAMDSKKIRDFVKGRVMTPCGSVRIKIDFHKNYVHCIAVLGAAENLEFIDYHIEEADANAPTEAGSVSKKESFTVRRLAIKNIAKSLRMNAQDIRIIRHQTGNKTHPPVVYVNGKRQGIALSLSHDGRFAACAFFMQGRPFF